MGLFGKQKHPFSGRSVEMLEACGDVNGLVQALSSRDYEEAKKAIESLKRIGSPTVGPLLQLCNGRDSGLQQQAAIILGHIKSKKAVSALLKLAYSLDVDVRACACLSLGPIDDDRAIGPLIYHLADSSKDVRDAAAFSLSCMGDRIILPVVASFARSNQQASGTKENLKTVKELGNFDASIIARYSSSRNQLEYLQDGIGSLIEYSDRPWIHNFLRCLFYNENVRDADISIVKNSRVDIFDPLFHLMQRESDDIRLRAVTSMGIIKDARAVKPLEQLLNDDSRAVREATAAVLRNITQTGLLDINKEMDRDPDKNRVTVTFQCEYCGVPVECGSKYCPACGALFIDTCELA